MGRGDCPDSTVDAALAADAHERCGGQGRRYEVRLVDLSANTVSCSYVRVFQRTCLYDSVERAACGRDEGETRNGCKCMGTGSEFGLI